MEQSNKNNETVTSSKFMMNHRDKHNIVDFLSANNSDEQEQPYQQKMIPRKNMSGNPLLNESMN